MLRPYTDFKNKRLWKRIDYDWAYWYQCVDLIKQYADEVLHLWKIGAIGNAKNIPNNKLFRTFSKFTTNNLMQWDIIVRTQWTYGHIAIVDRILNWRVYVLEQNGSWKNSWNGLWDKAIRIKDYPRSFYNIVLRDQTIIDNYNNELTVIKSRIEEYENLIKITKEYQECIRYS